jgi:predicted ATP-grasp superfamily ATP-dependent carboligase
MVLVTDGDQRSTLALVRSLGRAGIPVTVGASSAHSLAGSSRYCLNELRYPSPSERVADFRHFLAEEITRGDYRMLLPMTDVTVRLVAEMRDRIPGHVIVPMPSADVVAQSQDKAYVLALAQRLGIPCPRTVTPEENEDVREAARDVPFPVVVKSRFSHFYQDSRWRLGRVQYAENPQELAEKYRESSQNIPKPLVQEKLSGEGRGVFMLLWNGRLQGAFCHRRLREKPPWGGVSVYRESIPSDETLIQQSFALLQALRWQGVAMVEFKMDSRDRVAKLMEVNGRFWGSLQLAIDAGADFPLMLYRLACGEDVPAQFKYQVGVKSRWLLGDLDHLLITLRNPEACNGYAPRSRLRAVMQFLKFYEPGIRYEVLRMDDPRPGWFESKSYLQAMLKSLTRGGRGLTC